MQRNRKVGLVADLWPYIRLIQSSGVFFLGYQDGNTSNLVLIFRKMYSWLVTIFILGQYMLIIVYATTEAYTVNQQASCRITILFLATPFMKFLYFGFAESWVHHTLSLWNNPIMHPLFSESHARCNARAKKRARNLFMFLFAITILSTASWVTISFVGESVREIPDIESENGTILIPTPRLMIPAIYPFNRTQGLPHIIAYAMQIYFVFLLLGVANLTDGLFSSLVIYAIEQVEHIKEILSQLTDMSVALDKPMKNVQSVFQVQSSESKILPVGDEDDYNEYTTNYKNQRNDEAMMIDGNTFGPSKHTLEQTTEVRKSIRYWVERHKHIVEYVDSISEMYGLALLLYLLITTLTLTLLANEATKIRRPDKFAFGIIGYLVYSLGQLFIYSIFGNQLIEKSASLMDAGYSSKWYSGSDEAKTFVQIVCLQCQKPLEVTGATFFVVSLELFASVCGAIVTYFMVLLQLT